MLKTSSRVIPNPVNQQHQTTVTTRFCEKELFRQSWLVRHVEVSEVYEPRAAQSYRDRKNSEITIPDNTTLSRYESRNVSVVDKEIQCEVEHFYVNANTEALDIVPHFFCEDGIALLTVLTNKWEQIGVISESVKTSICGALAGGSIGGAASVVSASAVMGASSLPVACSVFYQTLCESGFRYAVPKFFAKIGGGAWLGFSAVQIHITTAALGSAYLGFVGFGLQRSTLEKIKELDNLLKKGIETFVDFCRPEGDTKRINNLEVARRIGRIEARLEALVPNETIRKKSSVFRVIQESERIIELAVEYLVRQRLIEQQEGA